jgi:membrane protein CcdC involved in cytochrome C biogenesis
METVWRGLSLLSIPLMAWAIWGLIRQVRKPLPIRAFTPLLGMVMSTGMLLINVVVLRQAAPSLLGVSLLVVGLGFGLAWGQTTRLSLEGEKVVARRSVVHLLFWAVSFAITQILATFATAAWVAGGLVTMFFAAGTTLGTNTNLLLRQQKMRRTRAKVVG